MQELAHCAIAAGSVVKPTGLKVDAEKMDPFAFLVPRWNFYSAKKIFCFFPFTWRCLELPFQESV